MAEKKTTTGQTSARMVVDILEKHYAFTPDTVVGYDVFENLRLSASVTTYTIINLMETNTIMETDGDRCHLIEKNWNKVIHKVSLACVILLRFPVIILLIFLDIQMLTS